MSAPPRPTAPDRPRRMRHRTPDLFPEHNGNEDNNQRFTTRRAISWCKAKDGVTEYDLDAAACEESHHAPNWYGWKRVMIGGREVNGKLLDDGLALPWYGNVFVNPPWDDIGPWVLRAWKAWSEPAHAGLSLISISMLLPGNRTHRPWWQDLVEPFRESLFAYEDHCARLRVHFAPERFIYGGPGNPNAIGVGEPNFTSVLLVWRRP